MMQNILSDLRYAVRQLRRSPVFGFTAVLTLALGVGANTAIFSLLDQALLRALPVTEPQQLVYLQGTGDAWRGHTSSHGGGIASYFSYPMYRDLRDKDAAFEGLLATSKATVDLTRAKVSEFAEAEVVSGNYFTLLGVRPALGRVFTQVEDTTAGAAPVAVLSFDYWRAHMNSDPSVINETISLNGQPFRVVGVAREGFRSAVWGETPALFVPMAMLDQVVPGQGKRLNDHTDRWLNIIGRLKDGVTTRQAEAMSAPLWHALRADELRNLGTSSQRFVDEYLTNSHLLIQPAARGFSYNRKSFQTPLLAIMGMAFLVLLIAAVNVASLLLVRSSGRLKEFSLRYALGARGGRIVQQLLLEGFLIGVGGGLVGILIAPAVIRFLVQRLAGEDGLGPFAVALDQRLLFFNFAVSIIVSLFFSLAPAVQLLRPQLAQALRTQPSTSTSGTLGFRRIVVASQIGLSLLLLVGAGLFVKTLDQLRSVDMGYKTANVIGFGLAPRLAGYVPERISPLQLRVLDALKSLPGVEGTGAANSPLLADQTHSGNMTFAGYKAAPEEDVVIDKANVSTGFFDTLRVSLIAGRGFTAMDNAEHPKVAVVNEALAKRYFGSAQKAVGQRVADGAPSNPLFDMEIIGVVRNFHRAEVREPAGPALFMPLEQAKGTDLSRAIYFYVRTYVAPTTMFASIRRSITTIDPMLAIDNLRTMDAQVDEDLRNERMIELLATTFGLLATALAGVGLYGVLAYTTSQRSKEIGIRIALGSSRTAISGLVLGDVFRLAGTGVLVGLPLAVASAHLLRSQLFGVTPSDPLVLGGAVALVALVALLAAFLPARKAASVDPIAVLRAE
ncbi:ABC transporter permease [Edaphobacter sp. HDX4]|uniref:ABC transporter permease n=1 Tax=Edaphobacter sp. HDX4 TaxID=2794064 RepID=UPI002FE5E1A3